MNLSCLLSWSSLLKLQLPTCHTIQSPSHCICHFPCLECLPISFWVSQYHLFFKVHFKFHIFHEAFPNYLPLPPHCSSTIIFNPFYTIFSDCSFSVSPTSSTIFKFLGGWEWCLLQLLFPHNAQCKFQRIISAD